MHRQITMSHTVETEIKLKLRHPNIGTQITFLRDTLSKVTIYAFITPATKKQSTFLRMKLIAIW